MAINYEGRAQVACLSLTRAVVPADSWCWVKAAIQESVVERVKVDGVYRIDGILKVGGCHD